MSIRIIARDLYRLRQEVERLEQQVENSSPEKKEELKDRLRKVRAEQNRMRGILDGAKEPPAYRKSF
jgi:cell division protein FtsL